MVTLSIIHQAQKRDPSAQRRLFELYGRILYRLAKRYLVDKAETEDAVSESFYIIYKKIDSCHFIAIPPFEMWMKQIVVRQCLKTLQKGKRLEALTEQHHDSQGIDDTTVENLTAEQIFGVIEALPVGYRTVFNLYVIEGYSHAEIAELLEISTGTSKSQLSKAKNILQQKIIELDPAYAKRKIV